ncbi:MAG: exodeoxyribonuclease VII small subunit [Chromatiales bacterium]|nr:exodeoxyribonuclease VII small subunit [Chromatiales bacterium]
MTDTPKTDNLEQQIQELESLVERMERGEQSLEESLTDFERGISLYRSCQKSLEVADQKVKILLSPAGEPEPFEREQ